MSSLPAITSLVTAIGVIVIAYWTYRGKERAAKAAELAAERDREAKAAIITVGDKVFEVGKALDGRLSQLLAEAKALAHAEGRAEGEQAQRERQTPAKERGG